MVNDASEIGHSEPCACGHDQCDETCTVDCGHCKGHGPPKGGHCDFEVSEPPGYWHTHRCARPSKAVITTVEGDEKPVCGIHRRMHEKRPLHSGWFMKPRRT